MDFEHYQDFQPGTKVIEMHYHWYDPSTDPLSLDALHNNKPLYICDNYHEWAAPHVEGMKLYEVTYMFSNPLVLLDQFETYENIFATDLYANFVRLGKFDAVFYTPHHYGRGERQGRIMHPKDQVIDIREVKDFDKGQIELAREYKTPWQEIMFPEQWRERKDVFECVKNPNALVPRIDRLPVFDSKLKGFTDEMDMIISDLKANDVKKEPNRKTYDLGNDVTLSISGKDMSLLKALESLSLAGELILDNTKETKPKEINLDLGNDASFSRFDYRDNKDDKDVSENEVELKELATKLPKLMNYDPGNDAPLSTSDAIISDALSELSALLPEPKDGKEYWIDLGDGVRIGRF
jgi:hypothetical protein